jgi:hypothetical protein
MWSLNKLHPRRRHARVIDPNLSVAQWILDVLLCASEQVGDAFSFRMLDVRIGKRT